VRRLLVLIAALCIALVVPISAAVAGASTTPVFPTVSGASGKTPTLTFPSGPAPTVLGQEILHHGSGAVIKKGQLILVDYVGQIWKGKVFDSSFGHDPTAFPIGVGLVIPAWDKELIGDHVGDRVLIDVPPADGYGSSGYSAAGITGKDVLAFVVDIDKSYTDKAVRGDLSAAKVSSGKPGVTVTGGLSAAPKIAFKKSTPAPKSESVTVLDRGHGNKINAGVVIMQLVVTNWSGQTLGSTWTAGSPTGEPVAETSEPGAFDDLVGVPLGSRVLIELPKNSQGDGPYALVADLSSEPFHGSA
jgi:peptidylprolyl isomerase